MKTYADLEILQIQRPCAAVEARESLKIFDKEWIVPIVGPM